MTIENEIRSMYREIVEYEGDFGDPIDTGSLEPFKLLRQKSLTAFQREGAGVAALCFLMCGIDNSTWEDMVSDPQARLVRLLLREQICDDMPLINEALGAFLRSEDAFLSALRAVFLQIVIPRIET